MFVRDVMRKHFVTLESLVASVPQALVTAYISEMPRHMRRVYSARLRAEAEVPVVLSTSMDVVELVFHVLLCISYALFAGTME
jgi:hypothetical protein